jgi:hypothetical protein
VKDVASELSLRLPLYIVLRQSVQSGQFLNMTFHPVGLRVAPNLFLSQHELLKALSSTVAQSPPWMAMVFLQLRRIAGTKPYQEQNPNLLRQ